MHFVHCDFFTSSGGQKINSIMGHICCSCIRPLVCYIDLFLSLTCTWPFDSMSLSLTFFFFFTLHFVHLVINLHVLACIKAQSCNMHRPGWKMTPFTLNLGFKWIRQEHPSFWLMTSFACKQQFCQKEVILALLCFASPFCQGYRGNSCHISPELIFVVAGHNGRCRISKIVSFHCCTCYTSGQNGRTGLMAEGITESRWLLKGMEWRSRHVYFGEKWKKQKLIGLGPDIIWDLNIGFK